MSGRIAAVVLVVSALLAGAALYYLQVYHYYTDVSEAVVVRLTPLQGEGPEPIPTEAIRAIDAASSPIRFRACFETPLSQALLTETYELYTGAEPLTAPGWFDCFDAEALGASLASGDALAFLGTANITYGIDRVVAVDAAGRGYAWHQINRCGEVVFDGEPVPAGCPAPPESD